MWNATTFLNFMTIIQLNEKQIIQDLIDIGVVKPLGKCSSCRRFRILVRHPNYKGNYAARCPKCRKFRSLTEGTFFENTHLPFKAILQIIFCWSKNMSQKVTADLTGLTRGSVNQFFRFLRDVASWRLLQEEELFQFGGEGHTVQIDESVVTKRKYNRGRIVKEQWVLGIYDTTLKRGLIIYVKKRDRQTLLPIIKEHVKEGSTIWTDEWKAYGTLSEMGYIHKTVNHSKYFKDPVTKVCTNGVEGLWSVMKRFLRKKGVMNSVLLPEHIDEFMWWNTYVKTNKTNAFRLILQHIAQRYNVT